MIKVRVNSNDAKLVNLPLLDDKMLTRISHKPHDPKSSLLIGLCSHSLATAHVRPSMSASPEGEGR